MDYQKSRVRVVADGGPGEASNLLFRARAGDMPALADFVSWSLYAKLCADGMGHDEAIENTWTLLKVTDITLKAVNG